MIAYFNRIKSNKIKSFLFFIIILFISSIYIFKKNKKSELLSPDVVATNNKATIDYVDTESLVDFSKKEKKEDSKKEKDSDKIINQKNANIIKADILKEVNANNTQVFDSLFPSFLELKSLSKDAKITFLWSIAEKTKSDAIFSYLIDTLSVLKPIDLTPNIIALYSKVNHKKKISLLSLLGYSLIIEDINGLTQERLDELGTIYMKGKAFLKDEVYRVTDQTLFDATFKNYLLVAPAREVIDAMNQLFSDGRDTKISQSKLTNHLLTLVLMDTELQNEMLPEILSKSYPKNSDFENMLSVMVNELTPNEISPSTRELLRHRIRLNINTISEKDLTLNDNQMALSAHVNALITLLDNETLSKETLKVALSVNQFILAEIRPKAISTVIVLADDTTLALFQKRKNEIYPVLENQFNNKLPQQEMPMIKEAMRLLDMP